MKYARSLYSQQELGISNTGAVCQVKKNFFSSMKAFNVKLIGHCVLFEIEFLFFLNFVVQSLFENNWNIWNAKIIGMLV